MSFSDKADVNLPPTADRQQAIDALGQLQAENGTAERLGDAITRSLDIGLDPATAAASDPPPAPPSPPPR